MSSLLELAWMYEPRQNLCAGSAEGRFSSRDKLRKYRGYVGCRLAIKGKWSRMMNEYQGSITSSLNPSYLPTSFY
jgi:hypothetical protein